MSYTVSNAELAALVATYCQPTLVQRLKQMVARKSSPLVFTGEGVGKSAMFAKIAARLPTVEPMPEGLIVDMVEIKTRPNYSQEAVNSDFEKLKQGLKERDYIWDGHKVSVYLIHRKLPSFQCGFRA